ncbi:hypothetical protein ACFWBN_38685 [Streptomyces sp. NPDC059989]|uniref:TRADD-N-associated membrane domain-containing protein n=1 Tax=Streptomyces sp. NPDC059989 TaxID=3347026 RepID=UPI003676F2E1
MGEWLAWGGVVVAVAAATAALVVFQRAVSKGFERKRREDRVRLLAYVARPDSSSGAEPAVPKFDDVGGIRHPPESPPQLGDRRDDFTPLLVEYYAYGLTQARSSFVTSQCFAGVGTTILLFGVGLAVWKAEAGGELYLGIVTSSVGLVTALIGQLFHRRADIALKHMADQTASLRDDRRAAESTQQAIGLLDEVGDGELRGRLQAALILRLSGAELPR